MWIFLREASRTSYFHEIHLSILYGGVARLTYIVYVYRQLWDKSKNIECDITSLVAIHALTIIYKKPRSITYTPPRRVDNKILSTIIIFDSCAVSICMRAKAVIYFRILLFIITAEGLCSTANGYSNNTRCQRKKTILNFDITIRRYYSRTVILNVSGLLLSRIIFSRTKLII